MRKTKLPPHIRNGLIIFARLERWGTCSGCPVDGDGKVLPELCEFTDRYDHQLTLDQLHDQYNWFKSQTKK